MTKPMRQRVADNPKGNYAEGTAYDYSRQRLIQWIHENETQRRDEQRKSLTLWVCGDLVGYSDTHR